MKKYLPILGLVALLASDAVLKSYVMDAAAVAPGYLYLMVPSLAILLLSAALLWKHFRSTEPDTGMFRDLFTPDPPQKRDLWFLAAMILAGGILRFWKLGSLFDGIFYDEAYKGLDAISIRQFHERPIFLSWNGGREALVAYLVAGWQYLAKESIFAVRAVEATAGCITLLFFFLFVRQIWNRKVAFLSLFLLTFSKYHILYCRFGIRMNLILLFETATLYFVARGIRSAKKNSLAFLLAGATAAGGFYSYIAYRSFPAAVLAFLFDRGSRSKLRNHLLTLGGGLIVGTLVFAPMAWYFVKHPAGFTDRMGRTALWSRTKEPLPKLVAVSAVKNLASFTYRGDFNPRHNMPDEPSLSPCITGFFLIGTILVLANLGKPYAPFLLFYMFFTMMAGFLGEAPPHASRLLGALPGSILLATLGILSALRILSAFALAFGRILFLIILGGALLTGPNDALMRDSALLDSLPPETSSLWGMNSVETDASDLMNSMGKRLDLYVSPQFFFHPSVEYLTYSSAVHQLFASDTGFEHGRISMVILQCSTRNLWWLRDDDGKDFFKWWRVYYGMDTAYMRKEAIFPYKRYSLTMRASDASALAQLQQRYPSGRTLSLDQFTIFLFKP